MEPIIGPETFIADNIACSRCFNIPLLGIEFILNDDTNISNLIKIDSFCVFNHYSRVKKSTLNDIFLNKRKKKPIPKIINCEYCKNESIAYLCLQCKRNICKQCVKYHQFHKLYHNNKDLITKKIINNFDKAKEILDQNILLIQNKINEFKTQLINLERLFQDYKDINNNLILLAKFIMEKNKNYLKNEKTINYQFYFNIKNVLNFNNNTIKLPNEDISIKSFSNILLDKIKTGSYFFLSDSKFSKNLNNYTNDNIVHLNTIKLEDFKQIKTDYSQLILLEDNNRIFGMKTEKNLAEVYNIHNKIVETSMKLGLKQKKFKIVLKDNIMLLISDLEIYILNSKTLGFIQNIKHRKNISIESANLEFNIKYHHKFIHGEVLSEDSIGIVYEGDLRYLDEEKIINNLVSYELDESEYYIYFIIYKKDNNNNNNYILSKIMTLLKRTIEVNEVKYVNEDDSRIEDKIDYCKFYFDTLNRIYNNEFIISFKSRIKERRNQYYYYITDTKYSNETIYYHLNIDDLTFDKKKICSSKENTLLIKDKNENKIYFLYNGAEACGEKLKKYLKPYYEFIMIKLDILNFKNLYYQNKTILAWNNELIYFGKVHSNNTYEIIKIIHKPKYLNIHYVNLNPNLIIYDNTKRGLDLDEQSEDVYIDEEENNFNKNNSHEESFLIY